MYRKQNMFEDGLCQQINKINGSVGWHTLNPEDWMHYPQQTGLFML